MPNDFDPGDWITTKEASELTGYSIQYVRRLMRKGRVVAKKWLRDWVISKQSLLEYKEGMDELGEARYNPWKPGGREKKEADVSEGQ
ncbi:MAG: helix-turn-helix domain-containing protein [Anaerolineae bacterium]|nr:helix-turn-helix domain-containing protein [Anaerolineae bacterium]